MDLIEFLKLLVPQDATGVLPAATAIGGLVFAIIEVLDKLAQRFGSGIPTDVKFGASLVGVVLVPTAALVLEAVIGVQRPSFNALFLVVSAIAWCLSQIAHGALEVKR